MKKLFIISTICAACLLSSLPAHAEFDPHDWQIRLRAISLNPDESGRTVSAVPALNGLEARADFAAMPELDITYFFTENFSAELILATTKHDVRAGNVDLGSVWALPPTLTAQYHFDTGTPLRPYVGAGINYTFFYGVDEAAGLNEVEYDPGFGYAMQAGVDYILDEHWMLNLDAKKIYVGTDVSVNNGAVTADVDLNPWVFGVGVGYRF